MAFLLFIYRKIFRNAKLKQVNKRENNVNETFISKKGITITMIQNKKKIAVCRKHAGISLISLIIMIIVMIILASIVITVSTKSYDQSLIAKQETERLQVVNAIQTRFGQYERNHTTSPLLGLQLSDITDKEADEIVTDLVELFTMEYEKNILDTEILVPPENVQNYTSKGRIRKFITDNQEEMEYTRILKYDNLQELGLENVNTRALYLVNYYSNDVVGPIN